MTSRFSALHQGRPASGSVGIAIDELVTCIPYLLIQVRSRSSSRRNFRHDGYNVV
jgi:hypothetical protein